MSPHKAGGLLLAAMLVGLAANGSQAADSAAGSGTRSPQEKMRVDEPMKSGMMKDGMKKGEVRRAADRRAKALRPMMEQEEKTMPQNKAASEQKTRP